MAARTIAPRMPATVGRRATRRCSRRPAPSYVYFTYGMHWMANIACGKEEVPSAVLIRGAGEICGPARLTKFLAIDKALNGRPLPVGT